MIKITYIKVVKLKCSVANKSNNYDNNVNNNYDILLS